jgi:hypothetical protein
MRYAVAGHGARYMRGRESAANSTVRQHTPTENRCSLELLGLGLRRENASDRAVQSRVE